VKKVIEKRPYDLIGNTFYKDSIVKNSLLSGSDHMRFTLIFSKSKILFLFSIESVNVNDFKFKLNRTFVPFVTKLSIAIS